MKRCHCCCTTTIRLTARARSSMCAREGVSVWSLRKISNAEKEGDQTKKQSEIQYTLFICISLYVCVYCVIIVRQMFNDDYFTTTPTTENKGTRCIVKRAACGSRLLILTVRSATCVKVCSFKRWTVLREAVQTHSWQHSW